MDSASTDLTTVWFLVKAVFLHHIKAKLKPRCIQKFVFRTFTENAWVLIAQTCPQVFSGYNLRNIFAKMAASAEKEKSDDRDKKVKGFFAEAVARYNYCLVTHPVLTKSVTRQVLYCSRMYNSVFWPSTSLPSLRLRFLQCLIVAVSVKFVRISTDVLIDGL